MTRIVRDSAKAEHVKELHDHTCQVCETRLESLGGPYSEGAHIKPLGKPHNGFDVEENILCLCPNCHVLFDRFAFTVNADGTLKGARTGILRVNPNHRINPEYLEYHRNLFENQETDT